MKSSEKLLIIYDPWIGMECFVVSNTFDITKTLEEFNNSELSIMETFITYLTRRDDVRYANSSEVILHNCPVKHNYNESVEQLSILRSVLEWVKGLFL